MVCLHLNLYFVCVSSEDPGKSGKYPVSAESLLLKSAVSTKISSAGPEVIKLFSCTTELSTKFQLLIKNI